MRRRPRRGQLGFFGLFVFFFRVFFVGNVTIFNLSLTYLQMFLFVLKYWFHSHYTKPKNNVLTCRKKVQLYTCKARGFWCALNLLTHIGGNHAKIWVYGLIQLFTDRWGNTQSILNSLFWNQTFNKAVFRYYVTLCVD